MAFRFLPKVPLSLRKPAAVMVVWRSSPHPDGQAAHLGHQVPQLAALLGPGALGAVHIPGQAHHNQFSPVGLGGLADFGRHLGHGFFLDLGFQGGGQDLAGVTDGQPGAAVAIINC